MRAQIFAPAAGLKAATQAPRSSFAPRPAQVFRVQKAQARRAISLQVQAVREWPDREFIAETKAAFPDKGVANVEEARVLFSEDGYVYLDVRSQLENDDVGKVKGSVNIPFVLAKRVWSAEEGKKVVVKEDNPDFIAMVEKKFPNKETKFLVGCSNGTQYSIDALEALDEAGYYNLVGLKGGYNAWFRVFDNKLNRRRSGEYAEQYTHDGDSCGIHSSGAGFDRVDAIEKYRPPVY